MHLRSKCLTVQYAEFYFCDPHATSSNGSYPRTTQKYAEMQPSWQHQVEILNRILSCSYPFSNKVSGNSGPRSNAVATQE